MGGGWSPIAAYRAEDGELRTFSAVCPHMKCVVRWNAAQGSFDCPCHGSRFDTKGEVLEGPALHCLSPMHVPKERQDTLKRERRPQSSGEETRV